MTSATKTIQVCLVTLTAIAVASVLTYTKPVLVPFVFAVFFYAIFAPIIYWIQVHLKLPRILALSVAMIGVFAICAGVVVIMLPAFKELVFGINNFDTYLLNALTAVEKQLPQGIQVDKTFLVDQARQFSPLIYMRDLTGQVFIVVANLTLIIIYTSFMIMGDQNAQIKSPTIRTILIKTFEYTLKKMLLAFAAGFVFLVILGSFQVDLTLIFTLAAILLNFIPTIGPIVAIVAPAPVVFYMYGLEWQFFFIFGTLSVLQFIIGNIIEPRVLADVMDLHPITVLICLVFWGLIWGVSGMFLAVPITAVLKIIFSRIEATQPFAEILAGRLPGDY